MLADGTHVYWTEAAINGDIARARHDGSAVEVLHPSQGGPRGLSACGDSLFWANYWDGQIQRGLLTGGVRGYVASGQEDPEATVCDLTHVYWASAGIFFEADGAVARVVHGGGNPQLLASGTRGLRTLTDM